MVEAALRQALRHDRWLVLLTLVAISALALGYTAWLATGLVEGAGCVAGTVGVVCGGVFAAEDAAPCA